MADVHTPIGNTNAPSHRTKENIEQHKNNHGGTIRPRFDGVASRSGFAAICRTITAALIRARNDGSHSEAITGKTFEGVPLKGHLHAHYIVTDENHDGRLDHATIYAPGGFDEQDVSALGKLTTIFRRGNRPDVRIVLTHLGTAEKSHEIPLFSASRRWISVTPFSLPRFSSRGLRKKPRLNDLPEAQIERELSLRGFPRPIRIKRIAGYIAHGHPSVRWLEFHTVRFNGKQGRGLAGFEIEFAVPVKGPITLGFGSHFSLGLFLPD